MKKTHKGCKGFDCIELSKHQSDIKFDLSKTIEYAKGPITSYVKKLTPKTKYSFMGGPISLNTLLADNCKLAKELWKYKHVCPVCEITFDSMEDVRQHEHQRFIERWQYYLHKILDLLIEGQDIEEYIEKTKLQ